MNEKLMDQMQKLIQSLTKKLEKSEKTIEALNQTIHNLKHPKIKQEPYANDDISRILNDAKEAMMRNVKRIEMEIKNAK